MAAQSGHLDALGQVAEKAVDAEQFVAVAEALAGGVDQQQNRSPRVLADRPQHFAGELKRELVAESSDAELWTIQVLDPAPLRAEAGGAATPAGPPVPGSDRGRRQTSGGRGGGGRSYAPLRAPCSCRGGRGRSGR